MNYEEELKYFSGTKKRQLDANLAVALFFAGVAFLASAVGCGSAFLRTANAEDSSPSSATVDVSEKEDAKERLLTRLFWQDRTHGLIYSGDLSRQSGGYKLQPAVVKEFPLLDTDKYDLVQMAIANGSLIVGVRDRADGLDMSGWIEIATGVEEEDHGDHSHWHYDGSAKVRSQTLDKEQGNPAHVYCYGKYVYIANDKKSGFTQVKTRTGNERAEARFISGGGGHITLAAVVDRIAYSTWIDREGDNAGRVDVVDLRGDHDAPRYSFNLPSGGIHGATACGNRVFFAPTKGVCWVDCDFDFALDKDTVEIHHLSLDGEPGENNYRTGAFESFRNHVLCIANSKSGSPSLCIIDGTTPSPKVVRISCGDLEEGTRVSTAKATATLDGRCFAYAFAEGAGVDEKLLIFELDPNKDRNFGDAVLHKVIDVGKSQLDGHFGHHGITFLDDGKTAVISNPGDGTLAVLDLLAQEIVQTIEVGGQPTHLVSHGGPE